jgi:CheY-like chemotaxis protein
LVEDNPDDVELTQEALADGDVETELTVAEDGVEALAKLRPVGGRPGEGNPDLILLDLNLPRKNGFQVLEEIKSDPDLKRIPVVVLTTSDEIRDIATAYDSHANAYVVKPIDLDEFTQAIQRVVAFWAEIAQLPPA